MYTEDALGSGLGVEGMGIPHILKDSGCRVRSKAHHCVRVLAPQLTQSEYDVYLGH